MPVMGEESFEAAVQKIMREQKVPRENAEKIVGSHEQKRARLIKLRLAAIGNNKSLKLAGVNLPDDFDKREKVYNKKSGVTPNKKFNWSKHEVQGEKQQVDEIASSMHSDPMKRVKPSPLLEDQTMRIEHEDKLIGRGLISEEEAIKGAKHNHEIVFVGHDKGQYKIASLTDQKGRFAKYWLLNAKQVNGNGWGISSRTAKENMRKFVGRPLVVTSSVWHGASEYGNRYEHPYLPTNDLNKIFEHQEKFRVGNIVDVQEDKSGDWFATIEMIPKFANMNLPPFCSPAIYQLDSSEPEGQISKWEALHLAALDENPAYGARIALLRGSCVGTANECKIQFKSAKQLNAVKYGHNYIFDEYKPTAYGADDVPSLLDNVSDDVEKHVHNIGLKMLNKSGISHPQSKKMIGDTMDTMTNEVLLRIQNNYGDEFEDILGDEENHFTNEASDVAEFGKYHHDKDFGYSEDVRRPQNKGEELGEALFEPFRRMKDEELSNISTRRTDYIKGKKLLDDFSKEMYGAALKSLRKHQGLRSLGAKQEEDDYDEKRDRRKYEMRDTGMKKVASVVCPKKRKEREARLEKIAIIATEAEIEGIKGGVRKYLQNKKPSGLEKNLFDKFISDDSNSAILLDKIQRTKDDVIGIPDKEHGGIFDEYGNSEHLPIGITQDDGSIYKHSDVEGYIESKLRHKLKDKIGQPENKTSDILERIKKGNPLQERIPIKNRLGKLKLKIAIVKSPDKYKVDREMRHTRVDSNGPLINKVPFGDEDRDTTQQYIDRQLRDSSYEITGKVRPPKPTQKDRKRIIGAKLAALAKLNTRVAIKDVRESFRFEPPEELPKLHPQSTEIQSHGEKTLGVSPTFKGSHFLTTDGKLLGTGKSEHRTMSHKILKTFKDKSLNEMAAVADAKSFSRWGTDGRNMNELLRLTGMSRVSADDTGINIDAKHPLTSAQRKTILNHITDKGISIDNVFVDDYTPTQMVLKQLRLSKLKSKLAALGEQNVTDKNSNIVRKKKLPKGKFK